MSSSGRVRRGSPRGGPHAARVPTARPSARSRSFVAVGGTSLEPTTSVLTSAGCEANAPLGSAATNRGAATPAWAAASSAARSISISRLDSSPLTRARTTTVVRPAADSMRTHHGLVRSASGPASTRRPPGTATSATHASVASVGTAIGSHRTQRSTSQWAGHEAAPRRGHPPSCSSALLARPDEVDTALRRAGAGAGHPASTECPGLSIVGGALGSPLITFRSDRSPAPGSHRAETGDPGDHDREEDDPGHVGRLSCRASLVHGNSQPMRSDAAGCCAAT